MGGLGGLTGMRWWQAGGAYAAANTALLLQGLDPVQSCMCATGLALTRDLQLHDAKH